MEKGTLVIVGLGYVGLPLATLAKSKGWDVQGLDIDEAKVSLINSGKAPLVDNRLEEDLKKYPITASTDPAIVAKAQAIIIAVPTPVTHENLPDLKPLQSSIENILPHLKEGQLLVVESTINPGVMDELVMPLLKTRGDLTFDADGFTEKSVVVLHCPERVNPGDQTWTVANIPRVIGGYSEEGVKKGQALYESILDVQVKPMQSVTEAEAVKILENTFRDVNIAFINEMAKSFAMLNIDIMNVIEGASTKPFAFMPHYPGNGVGGHCISVDPYYMIERGRKAGFDHKFLKLAREINDSMPAYTVDLMKQGIKELNLDSATVVTAQLGLAYKKDIDDLRESPALEIRHLLEESGAPLRVFDPFVPAQSTVGSLEEALQGAQVLMLSTNHTSFIKTLTPDYLKEMGIKLVIDGKNALDADGIAEAGILYYGVGKQRK